MVRCLTLKCIYYYMSCCYTKLFLLQAENIYNDEDPEGAADSEVQA